MSSQKVLKKGPGLPIVFLHGFLGTPMEWEPICSLLPPCPCIALDLPGHGNSPFTETFAIELPRFHLVGYSMGGRLALTIPKEQVASLTLISVHPGLKTEEERKERMQSDAVWAELLLKLPIDEFLERWYNQPIFKPFRPDLTMRRKHNVVNLAKSLLHYSLAKQPFYEMDSVLIGERDEKFRKLHANPILIPRAAHMAHLENPKRVAEIIKAQL